MVAVFTMNYPEEAIGVALAARAAALPVAISFTLETDGRLASGATLAQAIERTDTETEGYPAYYLINCAHPTHFENVLQQVAVWIDRVRGLRANASKRSHAELDESSDLDAGDPEEPGGQYRALRPFLPRLSVVGGCCGTDDRQSRRSARRWCGPSTGKGKHRRITTLPALAKIHTLSTRGRAPVGAI